MLRQIGKPGSAPKGSLGDLKESKQLLGNAMAGRRLVFTADRRDVGVEAKLLPIAVFEAVDAHAESAVMEYSEFFSKGARADVLILRSSRLFEVQTKELKGALLRFREENPKSAVIVSAYTPSVARELLSLADSGVVDAVLMDPPNDFEMLRMAADAIGRRSRF